MSYLLCNDLHALRELYAELEQFDGSESIIDLAIDLADGISKQHDAPLLYLEKLRSSLLVARNNKDTTDAERNALDEVLSIVGEYQQKIEDAL